MAKLKLQLVSSEGALTIKIIAENAEEIDILNLVDIKKPLSIYHENKEILLPTELMKVK